MSSSGEGSRRSKGKEVAEELGVDPKDEYSRKVLLEFMAEENELEQGRKKLESLRETAKNKMEEPPPAKIEIHSMDDLRGLERFLQKNPEWTGKVVVTQNSEHRTYNNKLYRLQNKYQNVKWR